MIDESQPEHRKLIENEGSKENSQSEDAKQEEIQEPEKLLVHGKHKIVSAADIDDDKEELLKRKPPFKIISREEWGADPPTKLNPFRGAAQSVRLIFTDSQPCRTKKSCIKVIRKLQRAQMRQGLSDIAYNFLIGGDCRIYEGRGWKEHPGITQGTQDFRTCEDIVIGYVGTFNDNIDYPEMADKAHELLDYGFSCGYMGGEPESLGGQDPSDHFANTGIDVDGYPELLYKSAYGV